MSDIVERLRAASLNRDELRGGWLAEAIDEIDRLRAENAKLREATTWRPIESAPKHESAKLVRVLLATVGKPRSRLAGYWDAYYAPGGRGYDGGDGWVIDAAGEQYGLIHDGPTHWMPLPEPPK